MADQADQLLMAMLRSVQVTVGDSRHCLYRWGVTEQPLSACMNDVRPGLVLMLGSAVLTALQNESQSLPDELRGDLPDSGRSTSVEVDGRRVVRVSTHSPVELLADPSLRRRVWADLCMASALCAPTSGL